MDPLVIYPVYHSNLIEASHNIHVALNKMQNTPCSTREDFEKLIRIYSDLADFMKEIELKNKE